MHDLMRLPPPAAIDRLTREHDLDVRAADNLLQYLRDQVQAAGAVPDASTIIVERVRDDLGDWRVCVLSPRGGRIHAPWAMAAVAKIREETGVDVETLWGDDGFVVRFPDVDAASRSEAGAARSGRGPDAGGAAARRHGAVRREVPRERRPVAAAAKAPARDARTAVAAAQAGRRSAGRRVALRLVSGAARDLPRVPARLLRHAGADRDAERRSQPQDPRRDRRFGQAVAVRRLAALQLRRELSLRRRCAARRAAGAGARRGPGAAARADRRRRAARTARRATPSTPSSASCSGSSRTITRGTRTAVHDMLLALGDLDAAELAARTISPEMAQSVARAAPGAAGRCSCASPARSASSRSRTPHATATHSACRCRRALPDALLEPVRDPARRSRAALRAHACAVHGRGVRRSLRALAIRKPRRVLVRLTGEDRLLEGEFRPGGTRREWTDPAVLRQLRRRSLAKLRQRGRTGRSAGPGPVRRPPGRGSSRSAAAPTRCSTSSSSSRARRCRRPSSRPRFCRRGSTLYDPADLDAVMAAGEVVWVGVEPLGDRDGRIALYLADHRRTSAAAATEPPIPADGRGARRSRSSTGSARTARRSSAPLHDGIGGGYPAETVDALWNLVWRGLVTNDAVHALRAFTQARASRRRRKRPDVGASDRGGWCRPRRRDAGVWCAPTARRRDALAARCRARASAAHTRWLAATAQQLLARHGVLTREADVRRVGARRIRRHLSGAESPRGERAHPPRLLRRRSRRHAVRAARGARSAPLAARTRTRNPRSWCSRRPIRPISTARRSSGPRRSAPARDGARPRTVGATVILVDGALVAYLARGDRVLLTWLPEAEPQRSRAGRAVAGVLIDRAAIRRAMPRAAC